eukprot:gene10322-12208_t
MGPTRALEPPPPSSEDLEDEAYQKLLQWNSHTAVSRVSHPRSPSSTASSSPKVVEKPPAVNIPKRIKPPTVQASRPASANPKVTALTASAASSASSSPASATTTVAVAAAHAVAPTFAKTRPSSANYARPSSAAVQRTPMSGASSPQRPTSAARALEGQDDSTPSQKSGARSPVPLLRNPDDFAHAAPPWPSRKSRSRKKGFQLETHDVKLPEYNAIEDRSLQQHFGKGIVQRDLRRSGVMTEEGGILDSETLRLKEYFEELSKEKERTEEVIKSIQSEHEKTFVERAKNEERARELGLQKVRMRQAAAAPVRTLELEKQIINNLNIELEYEQRCKQMLEHQATERYRIDTLFPLLSSPFREVNYAERVVDAFPPEDALGRGGPSVTAAGLDDALGSPVDSTNDAPPSPPHHSTAARHTYSPTPSPPDDFLAEVWTLPAEGLLVGGDLQNGVASGCLGVAALGM